MCITTQGISLKYCMKWLNYQEFENISEQPECKAEQMLKSIIDGFGLLFLTLPLDT